MSREAAALLREAKEHVRHGRGADAIRLARRASAATSDPFTAALNLGGILIDGGTDEKDPRLVREGVRRLVGVAGHVRPGAEAVYHYNLGNGYSALAHWERGSGPGTRPSLDLAISNLDESLQHSEFPDARTNLANTLMQQGRPVEALDEYEIVLGSNTNHHQALANRGRALIEMKRWLPDHGALLSAALADHRRALDLAVNEPVFAASYQRLIAWLEPQVTPFEPTRKEPTAYEAWIWGNRLALNPCPVCRVDTPDCFDLYPLAGRLAAKRRIPPESVVLDIVNRLCQAFATARWVLYSANQESSAGDHQVFVPSENRSRFGLSSGLLMSACTGFYSVLNNTAFALDSYFRLHMNPQAVSLSTVWYKTPRSKGSPISRADIRPRLLTPPNPGLTALYGLSRSLERGKGRYFHLRDLRNSIEHHIVVVTTAPSGMNSYFRSVNTLELSTKAIQLGRVAKAAIWYFAAAVYHAEGFRARRATKSGIPVVFGRGPSVRRA
jgi:tetratricopeptide (TPR) repeat protein